MANLVDRLGAALLDASLAATAITGLVVLAMVQCRQPVRRRGWARAGLLSTLALLPLAALNPVPRIDLREPIRSLLPTGFDDPSPWPIRSREGSMEAGDGADPDRPTCEAGGGCPPIGPRWLRWVARGLVLAYVAGASVGLGGILLGLWGSSRVVRGAWPPSALSVGHYRSLPFEGRSARPRLLVSERVRRPVLIGSLRPAILIPPDLDDPGSVDALRLSLLHELAHAEASDHQFGPAAMLARTIWFFVPPVWWIGDQLKLDQEFLADRRAVAHFGTSGGYATSLVELASMRTPGFAEGCSGSTEPSSKGVEGAGVASALLQRVLMLLRCPFAIEGRTPLWWRWSTAATLGLATISASCLTLRGMAGWSAPTPSTPTEVARSFRLPQLVIARRENDDQPFDLRFRLPDQFNLSFEIMAEPADLPALEVLGHRLGPTDDPTPGRLVYRLWHRVQIRRSEGQETVKVDDRVLISDPKPTKLAPWLTIRPSPGRTARVRDLLVSW